MAKRTIKTALGTYQDAKSGNVGAFGFRGQEVDVHADDLERFDALNVQPGVDPDDDNPEPVDNTSVVGPNVMVSPAAGEETSGEGSGLNDDVSEEDAEESGTAEEDAAEADSEDAPRPRKRAAKRAPARRR
jgi:hypothetical protein